MCELQRGSNVKGVIMRGEGKQWALDNELTLPILSRLRQLGRRVVLATETELPGIDKKYSASVYSRNEDLRTNLCTARVPLSLCRGVLVVPGFPRVDCCAVVRRSHRVSTGFQFHDDAVPVRRVWRSGSFNTLWLGQYCMDVHLAWVIEMVKC